MTTDPRQKAAVSGASLDKDDTSIARRASWVEVRPLPGATSDNFLSSALLLDLRLRDVIAVGVFRDRRVAVRNVLWLVGEPGRDEFLADIARFEMRAERSRLHAANRFVVADLVDDQSTERDSHTVKDLRFRVKHDR